MLKWGVDELKALGAKVGTATAKSLQQKQAQSAGQTNPASQSQGASLSGVPAGGVAPPSTASGLEGYLSTALQKSTIGVVDSAQSALHTEVKKAEGDLLYVVAGAVAGGLLYSASPLLGAGVGAGLALLYTSSS